MSMNARVLVVLLSTLVLAPPLYGQAQRYELGRRLRVFEAQWEKTPGDEACKRCVAPLNEAVMAFFTFRFGEAGRALDQARFALDPESRRTPEQRWAESLALYPASRLLDTNTRALGCELKSFYDVPRPADMEFTIRLALAVKGKDCCEKTFPIRELPVKFDLPIKEISEGDHVLHYEILQKKEKLAEGAIMISLVKDPGERMAKWKKLDADNQTDLASEQATLKAITRLIAGLKEGNAEETDYPASRLLREAEELQKALQAEKRFYTHERAGEYLLSLVGRADAKSPIRTFPMRVRVPTKWDSKNPPPLVVALHGAGGSENLFFDGYGNGKIVPLCEQRGWMLIAPRVGFNFQLGLLLDVLHTRYPFDKKKVFLIGHSMGAAQAINAVSLEPSRYAGVVALGGSGTFKTSEGFKKVPFYIGVGKQDFALTGARSLKERLSKAGVEKLVSQELANVEHLGIVQQSLAESFRFYDQIARNKEPVQEK